MPWTFATFLIACLSVAGIPPLSGFWSKDEILGLTQANNTPLFLLSLLGVFLTALYMFRALFMTFGGTFRGGAAEEAHVQGGSSGEHGVHLRESPAVMVAPLVLLALPSVLSGAANLPLAVAGIPAHWMGELLKSEEKAGFDGSLAGLSAVVALAGIAVAWATYSAKRISSESVARAFGPLYRVVARKYYMDELYENILVVRVLHGGVARALDWLDINVVDGVVNTIGWASRNVGRGIARAQTGHLQTYGVVISLGVLVLYLAYLLVGR